MSKFSLLHKYLFYFIYVLYHQHTQFHVCYDILELIVKFIICL
jgi:hypothetical protein